LIEFEGQELGYVPRASAQLLAPEMDSGMSLEAAIVEITRADVPEITIEVSLQPTANAD
jgi:hypothetical protein